MKEKDSTSQNELTNQPNYPKLGKEGDVFMPDGPTNGPEQSPNTESQDIGQSALTPEERKWAEQALLQATNASTRHYFLQLLGGSRREDIQIPETEFSEEEEEEFLGPFPSTAIDSSKVVQDHMMTEEERQYAMARVQLAERMQGKMPKEDGSFRQETQEEFKKAFAGTEKSTNMQELTTPLTIFLEKARLIESANKEAFDKNIKPELDKIEELRQAGDIDGIKEIVKQLEPEIRGHYVGLELNIPETPRSLEDLAGLIMRSSGAEWRTGGKKELINENGEIVKENFLAWIRKRMLDIHEFNPTSEVNFFNDINVRATWSNVTFFDMIFTGSYFLEKKREQIIVGKKADGSADTKFETTYHRNLDYEKLRDELINEVFLFQTSRNFHVKYIGIMNSEPELSKTLSAIYQTNVFTRSNFLESVFTMPSVSKLAEEERSESGNEMTEKIEKNTLLGEAVRKMLLSYYYIYDYEMMEKILGKDAVLFRKEYDDIDKETGKAKVDKVTGSKKTKISTGVTSNADQYDTNGWYEGDKVKLTSDGKRVANDKFMEYINIFTGPGPNKDAAIIDEIRERMALSLMEKMNISYEEAKLAESWAFSMTRWTGLAAKNDTFAVGHDAWTKALNIQEYRMRQMAEHRNSLYGNIFNVLDIKRIGLNFWEGVRDTKGRTVIEAIQGGQGNVYDDSLDLKKQADDGKGIRFNESAMALFSGNHIVNSFNLLEFIVDNHQFNFQEMFTFDAYGKPNIDYEKANKMIDGVQKAIRYMYSTWGGTDYSKTVRTWEKTGKEGRLEARDMPIIAELFGPEILKMLKETSDAVDVKRFTKMTSEQREKIRAKENVWYIPEVGDIDVNSLMHSETRQLLWKSLYKYMIKAEIESHRNRSSDQPRFNALQMEKIYAFLQERSVFEDKELDDIRKDTGTTFSRMALQEGSVSVITGGGGGALRKLMAGLANIYKV